MKLNAITGKGLAAILLLVLLCGYGNFAPAQNNDFAPLVDEDTFSIAKVDLTQINFGTLPVQITAIANPFIDALVPVKEDREQMKKSLPMIIGMMSAQYAGVIEKFKQEGVTSFYIFFTPKQTKVSSCFIAFPAPGKSKDETAELRSLCNGLGDMNINVRFPFTRHGFVIAPVINTEVTDDAVIKSYLGKRFSKLAPVEKPFFAQSFAKKSDNCVTVACLSDEAEMKKQVEEMKKKADEMLASGQDANKQFELLEKTLAPVLQGVVGGVYTLNTNDLALNWTVQMKTAADAIKISEFVPTALDEIIKNGTDPKATATLKENRDVIIGMVQPKIENEMVTWRIDKAYLKTHQESLIKLIALIQANANAGETDK